MFTCKHRVQPTHTQPQAPHAHLLTTTLARHNPPTTHSHIINLSTHPSSGVRPIIPSPDPPTISRSMHPHLDFNVNFSMHPPIHSLLYSSCAAAGPGQRSRRRGMSHVSLLLPPSFLSHNPFSDSAPMIGRRRFEDATTTLSTTVRSRCATHAGHAPRWRRGLLVIIAVVLDR